MNLFRDINDSFLAFKMTVWVYLSTLLPSWTQRFASNSCSPLVASLGLAVIDKIKFGNGTVVEDVLGGSGTYFSVGARLFTNDTPQLVAFRILAGDDFPEAIESKMRKWHIDLTIQKESRRHSVRGLLEYEDTTFGPKNFRYTTPVLQVEPSDLKGTAALSASAFHFLCHPNKVKSLVAELKLCSTSKKKQMIVWEPAPPACTPEHMEACLQAIQDVDVFSPNHLELLKICDRDQQAFSQSLVEECADAFLEVGIGPQKTGVAVIRAGEHGCMVKMSTAQPARWLPSYYTPEHGSKIVDTTGAGNAFLGGFVRGYQESKNEVEAACFGSVAASYMLEQIGVPTPTKTKDGVTYWNGEDPLVRLKAFKLKCRRT